MISAATHVVCSRFMLGASHNAVACRDLRTKPVGLHCTFNMVHQNGAPDITNAVGQRQLLGTLAHIASTSPHKTYLSLARSSRIEDGFEDLSYGRFNQAVDRAAFWLERHFGRSPDLSVVRPVFASLPRHDLRGGLLIAAAPKAGLHVRRPDPERAACQLIP